MCQSGCYGDGLKVRLQELSFRASRAWRCTASKLLIFQQVDLKVGSGVGARHWIGSAVASLSSPERAEEHCRLNPKLPPPAQARDEHHSSPMQTQRGATLEISAMKSVQGTVRPNGARKLNELLKPGEYLFWISCRNTEQIWLSIYTRSKLSAATRRWNGFVTTSRIPLFKYGKNRKLN